jgi:hypothetical protein
VRKGRFALKDCGEGTGESEVARTTAAAREMQFGGRKGEGTVEGGGGERFLFDRGVSGVEGAAEEGPRRRSGSGECT